MADRHKAEILGIGDVRPDRGESPNESDESVRPDEEGHLSSGTGNPTERGIGDHSEGARPGNRDVTGGTSGGTGPDTGGSGVLRRGSGATGVDLG
jgi:hypothetical protein